MAGEKQAPVESEIDFAAFGDDVGDGADEGGETLETLADDDDDADGPDEAEEADGEGEADDTDEGDDDDIEASADDDPEFEIDPDLKLKKSEIKELVEQKQNYSRYSDELQIVSREREALQAQAKVVFEDFTPKLKAEYEAALDVIRAQIPPAPDAAMMQSDPSTYLMLKEYREQAIANYHAAKGKGEEALARVSAEQKAASEKIQQQRQVAEMDKLLKAVPALKDERKADAYLKSCVETGKKYGYTAQEVHETILGDHRAALILRKAALYDAGKASKQPMKGTAKVGTTPRSVPAPKRSAQSPQNGADRRQLAKILSNPNASRSSQIDAAAAMFSD
jgi:hypothetical protein